MRYSTMRKYDVANGPGVRATLFVTGCTHDCEGCFNKDLQDFNAGTLWDKDTEEKFLGYVSNPIVVGINVLGGEPLQQIMDDSLSSLLKKIKKDFPEKSIWLWTGDLFEEAIENPKKMEILENVDVLIDGQFQSNKRNIGLKYRGSENQRVIDVKKSLESDEVCLYEFEEV